MDKKAYMDEQLNVRCFYLRLMKKIVWVPVAALAGAVTGVLLYTAVTRMAQPALYEAKAQFYLHFVEGATDDKVYDHYNAYTWNDLINADPVQNLLREAAENAIAVSSYPAGGTFTEETGRANMPEVCMRMYEEGAITMTVLQPSDIRILWLTVQSKEADAAAWFLKTAEIAMEKYGEQNEVFRSIELIGTEDVAPVAYPQRTKTAAATGAVISALIGLFVLAVLDLLDDAVYVPEDAEKRYGLPVVAVLDGDGKAENLLAKEARSNLASIGPACVLSTATQAACGELSEKAKATGLELTFKPLDDNRENDAAVDNAGSHTLLEVPFGKKNAQLTQHVLSQARARGENVEGIVMTGADMTFLQRYYGL